MISPGHKKFGSLGSAVVQGDMWPQPRPFLKKQNPPGMASGGKDTMIENFVVYPRKPIAQP